MSFHSSSGIQGKEVTRENAGEVDDIASVSIPQAEFRGRKVGTQLQTSALVSVSIPQAEFRGRKAAMKGLGVLYPELFPFLKRNSGEGSEQGCPAYFGDDRCVFPFLKRNSGEGREVNEGMRWKAKQAVSIPQAEFRGRKSFVAPAVAETTADVSIPQAEFRGRKDISKNHPRAMYSFHSSSGIQGKEEKNMNAKNAWKIVSFHSSSGIQGKEESQ